MHDIVIRGGKIVDGSGQPAFSGDIAITGGKITAVGTVDERGTREIHADGALVAPGWVDIHTHYDGQVTWDSLVDPSSQHGVTSVVMGNCGVGFAPARPGEQAHDFLISLMEGVEDIPGSALHEGLPWDWESFPDYLDAVDRRPHAIDIGAQMPHAALRAYVMGERGADHEIDPTPDEIAEMSRLTYDALLAGALGFATSRTVNHRSRTGQKIGSLTASQEELVGIGEALGRAQRGVFQFVSDFKDIDYELGLMRRLSHEYQRPLSVSLIQADPSPDRWRRVLDWIERAAAEGVDMKAQICARPVGLLLSLEGSMNPFMLSPTYKGIRDLPFAERVVRMGDPDIRGRILDENSVDRGAPLARAVGSNFHRLFKLGDPPDYEQPREASVGAMAERQGLDPKELVYDLLLERGGHEMLYYPAGNYTAYNLDAAREMVLSDRTLYGLSDGGAHVGTICDGSFPTFNLVHWVRDRQRGEKLPVELVVRNQCRDTARHVGWFDRGVLAPGYKADVNVIDLDGMRLRPPRFVYDLPSGGRRLLQDVEGYRYTVQTGQVTFEDGTHTGLLPGHVVRGAQPQPTA
jgi:N-acyl-D-aspartate/D-glutamate deacylase